MERFTTPAFSAIVSPTAAYTSGLAEKMMEAIVASTG